ncbi:hypothetical protein METESE_04410 [Mesoterricola sediminis]|uniref:RHS repeat-associated core domain-containing protein n=2 Tax=Mesoterricola sediminis TaxID=2927980 RepID=A0AA48HBY3_9BACT|nr:hypothetical protein METESE_04410 [Mesoterricola sediminis]
MQARFYLPMYGRFASPDPARDQHFEDTQSWNIYSYVRNNPVMLFDATGQFARIAINGNNMVVTIPVSYAGAVTADRIMAFTQGVERLSQKVGDINVTFRVDTAADAKGGTTNIVNFIDKEGVSAVEPRGGQMVANIFCGSEPSNESLSETSGHEGLHFAGALDAYKIVDGIIVPNSESGGKDRLGNTDNRGKNDVMFDPKKGRVSPTDLKQMVNSATQKLFKKENPNGLSVPENEIKRKNDEKK